MTTTDLPPAWADLIDGLKLLGTRPSTDPVSPFNCTHDTLHVMADPSDFTDGEIERLDQLGFHADEGESCFYSFRFGSA